MSEELEEQYEEKGYAEQGDKGYFRKDGPKIDKTMLLAWGISIASATVILLIATLIVIAVMEEEEEPIEYAIAPATMMEEQVEQQQEVKRKQLEKQASSSSINAYRGSSTFRDRNGDRGLEGGYRGQRKCECRCRRHSHEYGYGRHGRNEFKHQNAQTGSRCDKADRLRRLKREGGKSPPRRLL